MALDDDELDAIRRRKLQELQQAQVQASADQQYREQVQAQRQQVLRQILTPEARERLGRIELAYPELKESIENQLIALAQSGRVQRIMVVPLRAAWAASRTKRTPRAIKAIREHVQRHLKPDRIFIDDVLNEYLWKRGREHPPRRIRIKAIKFEDGSAVVSLPED